MPNFNVVVDHDSERRDVIVQLQNFSQSIRGDMPVDVSDVEESWDDNGNLSFAFKAMGFKIAGTMITCEQQVTITGKLPFAALPFRGAIENQIADKVKQAIEN